MGSTTPPSQMGRPGTAAYNNLIVNTPSSVQHNDDDFDNRDQGYQMPYSNTKRSQSRGRGKTNTNDDDDNKSHMSELTEDRTQRQYDAVLMLQQHAALRAMHISSPRSQLPSQHNFQSPPPPNSYQAPPNGPPTIIGVSDEAGTGEKNTAPKLETIGSVQPQTRRPSVSRSDIPKPATMSRMSSDVSSGSKLSVAQRSRIEAETRGSTPVRVRLNQSQTPGGTPTRGNSVRKESSQRPPSSNHSASGSFLGTLGRRLEDGLDNMLFGDEKSYQSTSDIGSVGSNPASSEIREEKKTSDGSQQSVATAPANSTKGLTLAERQALQRQRQMKFLKGQGIINDEKEVRGGASVASSPQI